MTSEFMVKNRDSIKLNILSEVINGAITLTLHRGNDAADDYLTNIRKEGIITQRYKNFNIAEDINNNTITIRPMTVDRALQITIKETGDQVRKNINLVRDNAKEAEAEFAVTVGSAVIELNPHDKRSHTMQVKDDRGVVAIPMPPSKSESTLPQDPPYQPPEPPPPQEVSQDEQEPPQPSPIPKPVTLPPVPEPPLPPPESQTSQNTGITDDELEDTNKIIEKYVADTEILKQKKESAKEKLRKIKAEHDKINDEMEEELEEERKRLDIAELIIEFYKDKDVLDVELLLGQVKDLLKKAEEHIKFHNEVKTKKAKEIEEKTSGK